MPGGQVNLTEELIEYNTVETDTEDDNDEINDDEDTEGLLPIPTQDKDDTGCLIFSASDDSDDDNDHVMP